MLGRSLLLGVAFGGLSSAGAAARPIPQEQSDGPQGASPQVQVPAARRLVLRVVEARPGGLVVVDRGANDGLEAGATVTFTPRNGAPVAGRVLSADARTAQVEMIGANDLPNGTRGETWIEPAPEPTEPRVAEPEADGATAEERVEGDGSQGEDAGATAALPPHPGWTKDDWTPDRPLLTQMAEVRPEDRARNLRGSVSFLSQRIYTNEDDREDAFDAIGLNLVADNPFGWGGRMQLDGAWTDRETITPDDQGEQESLGRLDRLSYATGGTRFEDDRLEVGRFLQTGMPEFGLLDGIEWGHRLRNGDRYGFSVGYLPEPFPEQDSGDDLQIAGYYEWVRDAREELTASIGYQSTWNDGDADRDLIVTRVRYAPATGWNVYASLWLDLYGSEDVARSGVGVTLADLVARRSYSNGQGMEFGYRHLEFPELLRNEFEPITLEELADDHLDRVHTRVWTPLGEDLRLDTRAGAWIDEHDDGFDGRVSLQAFDVFSQSDRWELTGFLSQGRFSLLQGVRLGAGLDRDQARYDLALEAFNTDQNGFDDDNDDFRTTRLVARAEWYWDNGWVLTAEADGVSGTDPTGVRLSLFAQRNF
jgi:hypothetical protein